MKNLILDHYVFKEKKEVYLFKFKYADLNNNEKIQIVVHIL